MDCLGVDMNAIELAEYLDNNVEAMIMTEQPHLDNAANMLRQQADKLKKYELRNTEQRKRIEQLEHQIEKASHYEAMIEQGYKERIAELEKEIQNLHMDEVVRIGQEINAEPVVWMQKHYDTEKVTKFSLVKVWEDDIPLYATPQTKDFKYDPETGEPLIDGYPLYSGLPTPQTKPLSRSEILEIYSQYKDGVPWLDFARAIEERILGK